MAMPTLVDYAKALDPDDKIGKVIELLTEVNPVLEDMPFKEGNLTTGHRSVQRSGSLPSGTWRKINEGVVPTKGSTNQVDDVCGNLEAYSEVDKKLADLNGNTADFRMGQDSAHLEGMSQEMATKLFYGNTALAPEEIMGFSPRYASTTGLTGENVLLGSGASTDNMSLWLVVWGDNKVHGIYPKGGKSGIQMHDRGQVTIYPGTGQFEGYRTHFTWETGLALPDWRYVVRVANIDVAGLLKDAATGPDLVDLMIQAMHTVPNLNGTPIFYGNKTVMSFLDRQTLNSANMNVMYDKDEHGRRITKFRGIPVKRTDALISAEALVS